MASIALITLTKMPIYASVSKVVKPQNKVHLSF